MSNRKARRMLNNAGILERYGKNYCVAESRLRERLPDMYERVYSFIVLQEEMQRLEKMRKRA